MFETLESRRLMSVSLSHAGTLSIVGTQANDTVDLRRDAGTLTVTVNGERHEFNYADVKRVKARLLGGNDSFVTHGSASARRITRPMTIEAGTGRDHVTGGLGNDVISGQGGNDDINGNDGNDLISGDAGDDHIRGGLGDDLLTGGSGKDRIEAFSPTSTLMYGDDIAVGRSIRRDTWDHDQIITHSDSAVDDIVCDPGDIIHADGFDRVNPLIPPPGPAFVIPAQ